MNALGRKIVSLLAAAPLFCSAAFAMTQSQIPTKFNIPWGNSASSSYIRVIPQNSQIGIVNCAASLTDGFPPLTFIPIASGGCPPFGQDFNGILKQITQWSQWQAAGGPVFYDAALSTAIGGYPKGAIVQSTVLPGRLWYSTVDNNTVNPDAGFTSNWTAAPGTIPAGSPIPTMGGPPPLNAVAATGLTIGNASSNATGRANADTIWLYSNLWPACQGCQLYNSAGGAIARGASAAADFAANNALALPNMNGASVQGSDSQNGSTSTFLVGVPVSSGSRTTVGSTLGENLHSLSSAENGAHAHTYTDPGHVHQEVGWIAVGVGGAGFASYSAFALASAGAGQSGTLNTVASVTGITINSSGSGTGHNTVPRTTLVIWFLAL